MGKAVRMVPIFRCNRCGVLYHPYQFGILVVNNGKLTEQEAVKTYLELNEVHECDIDRIGIAMCVGFAKEERREEAD